MRLETILAHYPAFGLEKYNQIIKVFGTPESFWENGQQNLKNLNWSEKQIASFLNWRKNLDIQKLNKRLVQDNIRVIIYGDKEYPKSLTEIFDPPFALFVRGDLKNLPKIAIVGTRKITQYGRHVVHTIVPGLARENLTIVSGLAFGVDKETHIATLEADGHTIAVLGGGIDNKTIAPHNHLGLALDILQKGGAIISEYPPGLEPNTFTFPKRNRIIAGLSEGTVVVEAPKKSGSLITAQCALDSAREVFAVPQNITSFTAEGPNFLIKNGAHPLTSVQDVLEVLGINQTQTKMKLKSKDEIEQKILDIICDTPLHPEIIAKKLNLPTNTVLEKITIMELSGKVKNLGGMNYIII
jgi:DNA processing protein